jgi:hypothetical protein
MEVIITKGGKYLLKKKLIPVTDDFPWESGF